jgi:hypothetical protein
VDRLGRFDTATDGAHRHAVRTLAAHLLLAAFTLSEVASAAELYKWVDADGAVTYGDSPPPHARSLRALGAGAGSLSVVSGLSAEQLERMKETARDLRIRRLEREVEDLQLRTEQLSRMPPQPVYEEPVQSVAWGSTWGWGGAVPIHPRREKRAGMRPVPRSRPDLELLPYVRAREMTTPPAAQPRRSGR